MAVVQGAELIAEIVDAGESAKSLDRPGMQRLLAMVDSGQVQCVIIAKLDRITRSVVDLAELLKRFERRGVSLVSVADSLDTRSASGRLVLNIMVSVSQWEREAIGERTAAVLSHRKAHSKVYGTTPLGFSRDGADLKADASEQETVELIRRMRSDGSGLRSIADELNRTGAPTKKGGKWHASTVAYILANSLYAVAAA
jgi:DNA invertase Pin-like site-specific DNA recombinase